MLKRSLFLLLAAASISNTSYAHTIINRTGEAIKVGSSMEGRNPQHTVDIQNGGSFEDHRMDTIIVESRVYVAGLYDHDVNIIVTKNGDDVTFTYQLK